MKSKNILLLVLIGLMVGFIMAMDYPASGVGKSNLRCKGGIISIGDNSIKVREKCGDPMRETKISDQPHIIWIYRFGQARYVHYFAFLHDRLQRIHSVRCTEDKRGQIFILDSFKKIFKNIFSTCASIKIVLRSLIPQMTW
jgi:hypothetical protein